MIIPPVPVSCEPPDTQPPSCHRTNIAIFGAGPVGLFAIFECGMLRFKCHVVDALDAIGGQCAALYPEKPIYDIPGYPRIEAASLIERLAAQAAPFHPILRPTEALHFEYSTTTGVPRAG